METYVVPRTFARAMAEEKRRPIVLVPTMGALHAGHGELIKAARKKAGRKGCVVVSIFVNPTQFGPSEDYQRYPRPWKKDRTLCQQLGADVVFRPKSDAMYAADHSIYIEESSLSTGLCGASRPGHFRGVCTVVAQLFHLSHADWAVFGEKDYQQLAIIQRMVRDLHMPVQILATPTVREPDGLAMSSRNRFLSPEERVNAPAIRMALLALAGSAAGVSPAKAEVRLHKQLAQIPGALVDYASIVDASTLQAVQKFDRPTVALVAVRIGETRLIDNIPLPW